jgi:hypothetical protein
LGKGGGGQDVWYAWLGNHDVIDLASQGVIIGKRTTNGGISFSAKGGFIPFDNNRLVKVKLRHRGLKHTCQCVSQVPR